MKNIPLVFLCACLVLTSVGCGGGRDRSTQSLALDLLEHSGESAERMIVYESSAQEGELSFMPESLKEDMYGKKRAKEGFGMVEEYVVYLSSDGLGELALFKCFSSSECDGVAAMLLERADALKVALKASPYFEKSNAIAVRIKGVYVMMAFVKDAQAVCGRFMKLI